MRNFSAQKNDFAYETFRNLTSLKLTASLVWHSLVLVSVSSVILPVSICSKAIVIVIFERSKREGLL